MALRIGGGGILLRGIDSRRAPLTDIIKGNHGRAAVCEGEIGPHYPHAARIILRIDRRRNQVAVGNCAAIA